MLNAHKKYMVEAFGTAVLVLMGCGSAVIAGSQVGTLGVAFGFGLSVVAMSYAIGHISGCHINPAVTVGMCINGRMKWSEGIFYIIAQSVGAIIGAGVLAYISTKGVSLTTASELGQNFYGRDGYGMGVAFVAEFVATMIFVRVVLGATSSQAPSAVAGLAIGLTLVLIHIVFIPVTGTSVNPARSLGPALLVGGEAINQLWLFWVAPILGAVAAGMAQNFCESGSKK